MEHLGDITKISGYTVPTVDCIIGGSPCQDLSVAGKRAGLDGERSGLYIEQVRIVKEMRAQDERNGRSDVDIRPRYMVWENVPGAFSSNKGEDFRIVLEELAKVKDKNAVIPMPPNGKWTTAGCIVGDGWSIAWRVLDSQFWGVPQRRRRITLIADFNGYTAPRILFGESERDGSTQRVHPKSSVGYTGEKSRPQVQSVSESVSGHSEQGEQKRKEASSDASRGFGADDRAGESYGVTTKGNGDAFISKERHTTLSVGGGQAGQGFPCVLAVANNDDLSRAAYKLYVRDFYSSIDRTGQDPVCYEEFCTNEWQDEEIRNTYIAELTTISDDRGGAICYGISAYNSNCMKSDNPHSGIYEADTSRTLDINCGNPACNQGGIMVVDSVPYTLKIRSGCEGGVKGALVQEDKSATLATNNDQYLFQPIEQYLFENHSQDSRYKGPLDVSPMLPAQLGTGGNNTPFVVERDVVALDRASFNQGQNAQYDPQYYTDGTNPTIVAKGPSAVCYWDGGQTAGTLTANNASGSQRMPDKENFNCVIQGINGDKTGTLDASYYKGCGMREGKERDVVAVAAGHRYIVRRLTPLECERLQGYPDGWTDIGEYIDTNGKKRQTSDAARYKALGNSIALPPWKWVLKRLCACYERDATMASLFDGIGGFPYLWEQINGKGTCLWASEIEEFPIAVTKARIL